jgi:hypothetical protein
MHFKGWKMSLKWEISAQFRDELRAERHIALWSPQENQAAALKELWGPHWAGITQWVETQPPPLSQGALWSCIPFMAPTPGH